MQKNVIFTAENSQFTHISRETHVRALFAPKIKWIVGKSRELTSFFRFWTRKIRKNIFRKNNFFEKKFLVSNSVRESLAKSEKITLGACILRFFTFFELFCLETVKNQANWAKKRLKWAKKRHFDKFLPYINRVVPERNFFLDGKIKNCFWVEKKNLHSELRFYVRILLDIFLSEHRWHLAKVVFSIFRRIFYSTKKFSLTIP